MYVGLFELQISGAKSPDYDAQNQAHSTLQEPNLTCTSLSGTKSFSLPNHYSLLANRQKLTGPLIEAITTAVKSSP